MKIQDGDWQLPVQQLIFENLCVRNRFIMWTLWNSYVCTVQKSFELTSSEPKLEDR